MATRSRRSAAKEVVEEEEPEQEQEGVQKLKFKQSLIGRPGKQIPVGELLTRLKALCDELRAIDQDEADRDSLLPPAQELAHHSLIQHKDAGVRAWTACCLVEMFRLCAPDAPYSASQLKDIFNLIVNKIVPLLADPSHPYNGQHLYVLRSLAEIKSVVLITDIPGSTNLTSALFTACFDVLSGPSKADNGEELSKNVEHHMTSILSILIDEMPALSSDVVDVIIAQFLWADPITLGSSTKGKKAAAIDAKQSTLRRKEAPPAYNMAKNLCNTSPEKMARLIGSYFSSVIVDFASPGLSKSRARRADSDDDSGDEAPKGPSEDDINDASKAHRLLRELWRCSPSVLQDIIPHLQEELGTENVQLRQLATETFGDMISGIGAAGPPPLPEFDPTAYPSQSLAPSTVVRPYNFLTTPASLSSFPSQYPGAYHSFLQRKNDKSPLVRASWTISIGRILMTSAGGVGLDPDEEQRLLKSFADCLIDSDERVRLAAVKAIEHFEFKDIVQKLGSNGSMSELGSILSNLADRVKDKKNAIHIESMRLLGRVWGVAASAIAEGNERITSLLGPIPSRILDACYVNDPSINVQIDLTLYEALLPLGYPPMKPKAAVNGGSQIVKDSQTNGDQGYTEAEIDKIRVERQLVLVSGLEEKAKKVFLVKQGNQAAAATYMEHFLKMCEQYNGGVMDSGEKDIKAKLEGLISYFGKTLPDSSKVADDLWKFAKLHDRRSYALIRFCMNPESDYRRVYKSIKEFSKRIEVEKASPALLSTLIPLLYRVSLLCYNKSHLPAVIEYTRTGENGLAATAHELLKEISTKHPKVFSTHVKDLCKTLESEAPTEKKPNPPGAVDDLKACASFAKKFPDDVPINAKENRKLLQSFLNFALYGSPPKAAKHAVTIIMKSDKKKELHAKEILSKSMKNFEYGCDHWLTKLAAISQLVLLAPRECEDEADSIIELAVNGVLLKPHPPSEEADQDWMETPDDDLIARSWALRILINRLRSLPDEGSVKAVAAPIYAMLNRLVKQGGEASTKKENMNTPKGHKSRQRLLAANFLLKLSCQRRLDSLLTPTDFNQLAFVVQDPAPQVRKGFVVKLMKYLGQNKLPPRYYTILFLLAHEPTTHFREETTTWLRSRRAAFASRKETVLETVFARLLSLLAHHPDFTTDREDLKEFAVFILYYLKAVATQDNLSLIYHVAQRVKGVADGIAATPQADENLYVLSDLAQALIRSWEEQNGWSMQSWPGKYKLPAGIFRALDSHDRAQEIADKSWIDEEFVDELEPLVRVAVKGKKRKATEGGEKPRKKAKSTKIEKVKSERVIKTPKKKRKNADGDDDGTEGRALTSSGPRRKSGRRSTAKSYVEVSSDGEDDTRAGAEEGDEDEDEDEDEEMSDTSEKNSPEPEEDVEMADEDREPEADAGSEHSEAESEPEAEPPKNEAKATRATRARGGKKTNGVAPSPAARKTQKRRAPLPAEESTEEPAEEPTPVKATPVKAARGSRKGKSKMNGDVASSSPVANGSVRRSTRSRG